MMYSYLIVYIIEAICCVFLWLIGFIFYKSNKRKNYLKFFGAVAAIYVVLFGITFIMEVPEMDVNIPETIEAKSEKQIAKPKTMFHFRDVTNNVRIIDNIDVNKLGNYDVRFEYDTMINTYSETAKVKVIDTTPPVIKLTDGEDYYLSYTKEYEEPGYTAIDLYDGDLTDKVQVSKENETENEYYLKYEVQDSSGNFIALSRHVVLIDDISPTLTLNGKSTIYITLNNKYSEQGAKALDEKDGDLTDKIAIEGSVDTSKTGTYTITYKVSDSNGNEAIQTRKVVVSAPVYTNSNTNTSGSKGVIYLTFDDGPSASITPKILDILKQKNVKATFFILNYDSEGEKLVQRAYNEGHTIGIHGYSHVYNDIYKSVEAYMENITKLQDKIRVSTGYNATITRFPGGSSNTVSRFNPGIMTTLTREVVARGYKYFDWNVSSGDAGGARNSSDVYNNVVNGLSKSRSNVVLMHDFGGNTKTLNALADIIDYGIANGYSFSRITENTPMVTHGVNN